MSENYLVLVYYNGSITASEDTIIFSSEDQSYCYVQDDISFEDLKTSIEESIETAGNERVSRIKYRLPISSGCGKICYRAFKLRNDRDVRMMFECHKRIPEIQIIELYVEFTAATSGRVSSQRQINTDDDVQHNMGRERSSPAWQVNEPERLSTEWRTQDDPPPTLDFTGSQQPSNLPTSHRHPEGGTSSFHDTHGNEFGGYERSSGDDDDGDSFGEENEASDDGLHLEDCNLEDVPIQNDLLMMPPMEPPAHMRTLDLEAMFA